MELLLFILIFDSSNYYCIGWGGSLCAMVNYSRTLTEHRISNHLATWITERDFKEIHDIGFNSVRLPIGEFNVCVYVIERVHKTFIRE